MPCPYCGAAVGELCRVNTRTLSTSPGRPIVHTPRRTAWQTSKHG
ncbi:MAG: zinc finger domain-containing protein [Candidatus Eremiobacter antarcticus]